MGHHALVFGGSGVLEWAVANEILRNYSEKGTSSRVIALTNRPLTREEDLWPESTTDVPALNILSGIDLTSGTVEDTKERLKERVPDIQTVDHGFYYGKHDCYTVICMTPDLPTSSIQVLPQLSNRN
ncbi:hypothetical protein B0J12DRAFT_577227 [Macrophomina phaseolina]|uniref:PRISE-like Rossmann-fold domain-containing protein n=1 Tax=Macrophomina phaseolina TaxID=35725 RepID=A0ABQ8G5I3_9PEZI|nr:hypothetical protein B0J12DRAFT_577227 [Macrophomina phaseolina]